MNLFDYTLFAVYKQNAHIKKESKVLLIHKNFNDSYNCVCLFVSSDLYGVTYISRCSLFQSYA